MRIYDPATGRSYVQKRLHRFDEPGHARELTFTCFHGYRFLSRDRTRQWFIDAIVAARLKWPFDLWAYVIMPEHVHLLVYPRAPELKIGRVVEEIKEAVARRAITHLETSAPEWLPRITVPEGKRIRRRFWQPGGGFGRNAVELPTVHRMIEYIHANPVRRRLVDRAEDWQWSSAGWYTGIRPVPIEMDRTIPMLHSNVK